MTITRSVTVTCDECFAMESSDEFLAVHLASVWAAERGWSYDTLGNNWCPPCTATRNGAKRKRRKRDTVRD